MSRDKGVDGEFEGVLVTSLVEAPSLSAEDRPTATASNKCGLKARPSGAQTGDPDLL